MLKMLRNKMLDVAVTLVDYVHYKLTGENGASLPSNIEIVTSLPPGAAAFNLSAGVQMAYSETTGKLSICITDMLLLGDKNSTNAASYLANAGRDALKYTVAAIALVLYKRIMEADMNITAKQETPSEIDAGYVN